MNINDNTKFSQVLFAAMATIVIVMYFLLFFRLDDLIAKILLSSFVLLFALVFFSVYFLNAKHYVADSGGITTFTLGGMYRVKTPWEDFGSLYLYSASYGRGAHTETVFVMCKPDVGKLPPPRSNKDILWFNLRFNSLVTFKFTMERYEYIRKFCDLPLIDNR